MNRNSQSLQESVHIVPACVSYRFLPALFHFMQTGLKGDGSCRRTVPCADAKTVLVGPLRACANVNTVFAKALKGRFLSKHVPMSIFGIHASCQVKTWKGKRRFNDG